MRSALRRLRLRNEDVIAYEHQRKAKEGDVSAPWPIRWTYNFLCFSLDILYKNRPIQSCVSRQFAHSVPMMCSFPVLAFCCAASKAVPLCPYTPCDATAALLLYFQRKSCTKGQHEATAMQHTAVAGSHPSVMSTTRLMMHILFIVCVCSVAPAAAQTYN